MKVVSWNRSGRADANASLGHVWDVTFPDVLAITETWKAGESTYDTNAQAFYAPGYRGEGASRNSGGVCMLVKRGLKAKLLHMESGSHAQCVIALVQGVVVAAVYISPSASAAVRAAILQVLLEYRHGKCFFTGDFNARNKAWCSVTNAAGRELSDWTFDHRLTILAPSEPTYHGVTGSSTIDLGIMTHHIRGIPKVRVLSSSLLSAASDHAPVEFMFGDAEELLSS